MKKLWIFGTQKALWLLVWLSEGQSFDPAHHRYVTLLSILGSGRKNAPQISQLLDRSDSSRRTFPALFKSGKRPGNLIARRSDFPVPSKAGSLRYRRQRCSPSDLSRKMRDTPQCNSRVSLDYACTPVENWDVFFKTMFLWDAPRNLQGASEMLENFALLHSFVVQFYCRTHTAKCARTFYRLRREGRSVYLQILKNLGKCFVLMKLFLKIGLDWLNIEYVFHYFSLGTRRYIWHLSNLDRFFAFSLHWFLRHMRSTEKRARNVTRKRKLSQLTHDNENCFFCGEAFDKPVKVKYETQRCAQ